MKKPNLFKSIAIGFTMLGSSAVFAQSQPTNISPDYPVDGKKMDKVTQKILENDMKAMGIDAQFSGIKKQEFPGFYSFTELDAVVYESFPKQPDGSRAHIKMSFFFKDKNGDNVFQPNEITAAMLEAEDSGAKSYLKLSSYFTALKPGKGRSKLANLATPTPADLATFTPADLATSIPADLEESTDGNQLSAFYYMENAQDYGNRNREIARLDSAQYEHGAHMTNKSFYQYMQKYYFFEIVKWLHDNYNSGFNEAIQTNGNGGAPPKETPEKSQQKPTIRVWRG